MRTKKQIIDQLADEPLYRSVMTGLPAEERSQIESAVQNLIIDVVMQMEEFADQIKENPEAQAELARGLTGDPVLVNTGPDVSGSIG